MHKKALIIGLLTSIAITLAGCSLSKKEKPYQSDDLEFLEEYAFTETETEEAPNTESGTEQEDVDVHVLGNTMQDQNITFTEKVAVVPSFAISSYDSETRTLALRKEYKVKDKTQYAVVYVGVAFDYMFRKVEKMEKKDGRLCLVLSETPAELELSQEEFESLVDCVFLMSETEVESFTPEADEEEIIKSPNG